MVTRRSNQSFTRIDAATIRVSPHGMDLGVPPWPCVASDAESAVWSVWLKEVWGQPVVAASVMIASPALAERVEAALHTGTHLPATDLSRIALAVARYLVRMGGRATPFGIFAGVAPAHFGTRIYVHIGTGHHTRTRPDSAWLAAVIAQLEGCVPLRRRLTVSRNDLSFVRAGRLVITWQPHAGKSSEDVSREIDIRHVPVVAAILAASQVPILVRDLMDKVLDDFPAATDAAVDAVVATLVEVGALITCLRPAGTCTDTLEHLISQLTDAGADDLPEVSPILGQLRHIQNIQRASDGDRWEDPATQSNVRSVMREVVGDREQVTVTDLKLDATVILPERVATEATSAASALLRLGTHRNPDWHAYHMAFLTKYGAGAVVPLRELTDPMLGLGYPRHFHGTVPPRPASPRDEVLLRLVHEVTVRGGTELVLDETTVNMIAAAEPGKVIAPSNADICVDIRASTADDLSAGQFLLGVNGVGRSAAATAGRFLDMFDDEDRDRMLAAYTTIPANTEGGIVAQISFPPNSLSLENVVHTALVTEDVITLGEHRHTEPGQLRLDDLAVSADRDRMYLVCLSRGRIVEPLLANASARHTMPLIGRFLVELARAAATPLTLFSWGVAECLPVLPRVRYGRTILRPAQWRINTAQLARAASPEVWETALARLRADLRLPAYIHIGSGDQRLRLNLDEPMDRAVLRDYIAKQDPILVTEAPSGLDHGWIDGRAHEIVIPFATITQPARAPRAFTSAAPLPIVTSRTAVVPGGKLLFAKLHCDPSVMNTILTEHMYDLLTWWHTPPQWWFIRFRDPTPHLRIRLHIEDYGQAANHIGLWATQLRERGLAGDLTLDTYQPETARYGSGKAMDAAEALFAADSAAVIAQLRALADNRDWHPQVLTAVSMIDLASACLGSLPKAMCWLLDHSELADTTPARGRTRLDAKLVEQAALFAGVLNVGSPLKGNGLMDGWLQRHQAARRYTCLLIEPETHLTPASVLVSLLHMHHIRVHGIDSELEATTHRIARAVALRWKAHLGRSGA